MKFGDQIKNFAESAKEKIDAQVQDLEQRAKAKLHELLGDDVALVKSISLDADVGKFHLVDAPQSVVDRIRAAGLLKD